MTTTTTTAPLDLIAAANPTLTTEVALVRELVAIDAAWTAFVWSPDVSDPAAYRAALDQLCELAARAVARHPDANRSDTRLIACFAGVTSGIVLDVLAAPKGVAR